MGSGIFDAVWSTATIKDDPVPYTVIVPDYREHQNTNKNNTEKMVYYPNVWIHTLFAIM